MKEFVIENFNNIKNYKKILDLCLTFKNLHFIPVHNERGEAAFILIKCK